MAALTRLYALRRRHQSKRRKKMRYSVAWYTDDIGVVATVRETVFGAFSTKQAAIDAVTAFFKKRVTFTFI